ncbi:MAG: hypothetical protein KUG82_13910 [Pseudomonadales bacterium]|nr:hypothetical protein [Pseudomonadales bacterium]
MEKIERVSSVCGMRIIEITRDGDGSYLLRKFVRKYDAEEEKLYEIREYPDPAGRFGDFESAIQEARDILR